MPIQDTLPILQKAEAPAKSSVYLVRKHGLPDHLRPYAVPSLGRWLTAQPDCRSACVALGADADLSAHRASGRGEPVDSFRLSTDASHRTAWTLKNLRLADMHAKTHADPQVAHSARKVIRGFRADRLDWDQLMDALQGLRSLITASGHRRARIAPVAGAEVFRACKGKSWARVITVDRLQKIGARHGLCTAASHSRSADYARALREGSLKFYELLSASGEFLALLSIQADSNTVEEMRAPGNELAQGINGSVKRLLKALSARVGDCDDLLGVGLTDEFLDRDLSRPDGAVGKVRLWKNEEGSFLIEEGGRWANLKVLDEGVYIGRGSYDADNLLGALAEVAVASSSIGR